MPNEAQAILIRLVMHPTNNPHMIDKLIVIKALPYDWIFKKAKYRIDHESGEIEEGVCDKLLPPWEPDADVNIPKEVRARTEPITYIKWFPDVRHQDKTYKGFWDKRTVWGLKLDYGFGPAQEMWKQIEDYMDRSLMRGEKMPEAVQVAKDQKSEFRTFLVRRGRTLSSLEMVEMDVPIVDLRTPNIQVPITTAETFKTIITVPTNPQPPAPEVQKESEHIFKCQQCNKEFDKPRALSMHKVGAHRKEKVKV